MAFGDLKSETDLSLKKTAVVNRLTYANQIKRAAEFLCKRLGDINVNYLFAATMVIAMTVVAWLFFDPRFEASIDWWRFSTSAVHDQDLIRDMGDWLWLALRNKTGLLAAGITCFISMLAVVSMIIGKRANRSIRSWLFALAVVAIWLSIGVGWQDIAWAGKQFRVRGLLAELEPIVYDLRHNWPVGDNEREGIGQFMGYPAGNPETLILLTLPEFRATATATVSVVEGKDDVIRFELVGAEQGDWIEWHPPRSRPASFISGLRVLYKLERYQRLLGNWYLVRYSVD